MFCIGFTLVQRQSLIARAIFQGFQTREDQEEARQLQRGDNRLAIALHQVQLLR